ncbi:MAG: hypothetical protein ACRDPI_04545 [Nocardioidaceae bacterium]
MVTMALDPRPEASARVLDRAAEALRARAAADVALLTAALEWAELHPVPEGETSYAGWGERDLHGEGVVPLAGQGAPLVAEFAPVELAAVLGWTPLAASRLMADALELKHRLPRLWGLVGEGKVPVHLARHVADQTTDLSPEAARHADRLVTWDPRRLNRVRVERLVDEARLFHDPDRAVADEERALAGRGVRLRPGSTAATTDVQMTLDTQDASRSTGPSPPPPGGWRRSETRTRSTSVARRRSASSPTRSVHSTCSADGSRPRPRRRPRSTFTSTRRPCSLSTPTAPGRSAPTGSEW